MNLPPNALQIDQDGYDVRGFSHGLYIDGKWRPSSDGRLIDVVDPSSGAVIAAVPDATLEDATAAVEAAAKAAKGWRETAPRKRSEILRRCFELMVERSETLAMLISLENGKALRDARGEVAYAAEFFRWNAKKPYASWASSAPRPPVRTASWSTTSRSASRADHAMELSGRHGDTKDRAGARRRVHRHPQTGQRDAADGLCAGRISAKPAFPPASSM